MFRHERSLVERLKDAPFASIGVNSDPNYEELKKPSFVTEKITWRSFLDWQLDLKQPGNVREISKDWKVTSWPTLFLIDAEGKFRRMWRGAPDPATLDREIDAAIAEVLKSRR